MAESQPILAHAAPLLPTHRRFRNLTGKRFGRLTAREFVGMKGRRGAEWLCDCDCGGEVRVLTVQLIGGITESCGCKLRETLEERNTTHGLSHLPEYRIWQKMNDRCQNPNAAHYDCYGGRGIRVCDRWRDFALFYADMGPRPSPQHELDRYPNNDGNYEPANCRWATKKQQARNRRTNRLITFGGETMCLQEWAQRLGITSGSLGERISKWPLEKALTAPARRRT